MGKRARNRKLIKHMIEKQVVPQLKAEELRAEGHKVEVAFVSTAPDAVGFDVECAGCGRKARLPFDPGPKVGLCPNCIPE